MDPELMLQSALWILQMVLLLLQVGHQAQAQQATGGLPGRDKDAKGTNKEGSKDNRRLYFALTILALISGALVFYLPKVSPREMFGTRPWKASDDFDDDTFDDRCFFSIVTFDNWCNECDPTKRGLQKTTFQPRRCLGEGLEGQKACRFGTCVNLFVCNHLDCLDEELPIYGLIEGKKEGKRCNNLLEPEVCQRLVLATIKKSMEELESVVEFVKDEEEQGPPETLEP